MMKNVEIAALSLMTGAMMIFVVVLGAVACIDAYRLISGWV